jgi:hypothetical protein
VWWTVGGERRKGGWGGERNTYGIEFRSCDLLALDRVLDGGDALVVSLGEDEVHLFERSSGGLGEEEIYDGEDEGEVDHGEQGVRVLADGSL